jgi:hypothetical protein
MLRVQPPFAQLIELDFGRLDQGARERSALICASAARASRNVKNVEQR